MSVQSFDIETLLQFKPPKYLCEKCCALMSRLPWEGGEEVARCPVCGVGYMPSKEYPLWNIDEYLKAQGLGVQFDDLIEHSRELAGIAQSGRMMAHGSQPPRPCIPPMRTFFEALQKAEQFVHFVTYGISHMLLGAIKVTAVKVPVRGIVSGVRDNITEELTKYEDEAPRLEIRLFKHTGPPESWDRTPHQKIIIIDGLMAFKGSANLTISGWRKAALGRDTVESVTDVAEVIHLNNRLFSPIWAEFDDRESILAEVIPF